LVVSSVSRIDDFSSSSSSSSVSWLLICRCQCDQHGEPYHEGGLGVVVPRRHVTFLGCEATVINDALAVVVLQTQLYSDVSRCFISRWHVTLYQSHAIPQYVCNRYKSVQRMVKVVVV
jgi:hypothetical protein